MNTNGQALDSMDCTPLPAVLGHIYSRKLTGTLKAHDHGGTSVPFVFWFKRGFPCFSYSRDRVARLGELLADGKRDLVDRLLSRTSTSAGGPLPLCGQLLISESMATIDEIKKALTTQMQRRLLCAGAAPDYTFQFDEGMDEFGVVPLSSPLLNPLEAAARTATAAPFRRVRDYLMGRLERPQMRLAMDRRIPPAARRHLSDTFVDSLTEAQPVDRALEIPSQLRTLLFLYSFGFVELLEEERAPAKAVARTASRPAIEPEDDVLSWLVTLTRSGTNHYEILQLAPTASRAQIKASYRNIAFAIHPDRVRPEQIAASQEVFAHVVDAYHTLSKERLRTAYDSHLVLSGAWRGLGASGRVLAWLQEREQFLRRVGLSQLATEYTRMAAALNFGALAEANMLIGEHPID